MLIKKICCVLGANDTIPLSILRSPGVETDRRKFLPVFPLLSVHNFIPFACIMHTKKTVPGGFVRFTSFQCTLRLHYEYIGISVAPKYIRGKKESLVRTLSTYRVLLALDAIYNVESLSFCLSPYRTETLHDFVMPRCYQILSSFPWTDSYRSKKIIAKKGTRDSTVHVFVDRIKWHIYMCLYINIYG